MIPPDHDWLDVLAGIAGILLGLGGLGALVTAIIYLFKMRTENRKTKVETNKTEAETIVIYQNIAERSADKALKLDARVTTLEALVDKQAKEIRRLSDENAELRRQIAALSVKPVRNKAKSQVGEATL
jgi:hypothetical protein